MYKYNTLDCFVSLLLCVRMRPNACLVALVCVRTCVYVYIFADKSRLFTYLPLVNFLLSVVSCLLFKFKCPLCGLLHPASCIQTEQFMLFQLERGGPLASKYFLLSFKGTPHPLG